MNRKIILRILILLVAAALAYLWADGMFGSLFVYRSPLSDSPPAPGQMLLPEGAPAERPRVVFVLMDGLRVDTALDAAVMPTLAMLRAQGASAVQRSRPSSYSQTGYASLLTGAWPEISDGGLVNLETEDLYPWTQDNLFAAAKRAGLKTALAGYFWFETLVPQQFVDAGFYTPGEDRQADQQVMDAALPWLKDGEADFVLIHLDQVDYAGHHEGGPVDARWNAAATRVDSHLAEIVAEMDLSRDVLFVTSDHGHIFTGGHGGTEPDTLTQPFVLVGAGVQPGDYGQVDMVDVAPTLAAVMGLNLPASAQGRVLTEMLDLPEQTLAALPQAAFDQQRRLLAAYQQAIGVDAPSPAETADPVAAHQQAMAEARQSRLDAGQWLRGLIAALALLVPLLWLIRWNRSEFPWLVLGAVLYVLVFHLRYYLLNARPYSLSSLVSAEELLTYVGSTAIAAMIVAWVAALMDRKVFDLPPADAALWSLNLSLATCWLALLPALWSLTLNGAFVTWTVPDFTSLFHGFLALLQVMVVALIGPALAGAAAGAAWWRRRKKVTADG